MVKFIATLMVAFQKFTELFSDDEDFDPTWMDAEKWRKTRV